MSTLLICDAPIAMMPISEQTHRCPHRSKLASEPSALLAFSGCLTIRWRSNDEVQMVHSSWLIASDKLLPSDLPILQAWILSEPLLSTQKRAHHHHSPKWSVQWCHSMAPLKWWCFWWSSLPIIFSSRWIQNAVAQYLDGNNQHFQNLDSRCTSVYLLPVTFFFLWTLRLAGRNWIKLIRYIAVNHNQPWNLVPFYRRCGCSVNSPSSKILRSFQHPLIIWFKWSEWFD